jgi:hypothetical protein
MFIKVDPVWSYTYAGAAKDLIALDTYSIAKLYQVACEYVVLRHNFISGHIDNNRFTVMMNALFRDYEYDTNLHGVTKYYAEDLYRRVRPVLDMHRGMLQKILFYNDDRAEVIGLVFEYVVFPKITSYQFATLQ